MGLEDIEGVMVFENVNKLISIKNSKRMICENCNK